MRKNFQVWKLFERCELDDYKPGDEVYYTIPRKGKDTSDDLHGPFTLSVPDDEKKYLVNRQNVRLPAFSNDRVFYWRPVA